MTSTLEYRLQLLLEEEERLRGDQEDCFPKLQPWTVWLHRDMPRGILVRFSDLEEAYTYAKAALYNDAVNASVYLRLDQIYTTNNLYSVGQTLDLNVFLFRGTKVPDSVLHFKKEFYLMYPTHALKFKTDALIEHTNDKDIMVVPLTVDHLDHWTECLSDEAKVLANI